MRIAGLGFFLAIVLATVAEANTVIHVPGDQPTIQAGINAAAPGDVVLVDPFTYTGAGNKNLDFGGKDIEVRSSGGAAVTTIDCQGSGRGFIFLNNETSAALVDGFTITHGDGGGDPSGGGAMVIYPPSSPTVSNCVFRENTAPSDAGNGGGGGIACYYTSPTITNCSFIQNSAVGNRSVGGAIASHESAPAIAECTFDQNAASSGEGGAVTLINIYQAGVRDFVPTVSSCTFTGNSCGVGAGLDVVMGNGNAVVSDCSFVRNTSAGSGGGFNGINATLTRCTFIENTAGGFGGGGEFGNCTVSDCRFEHNSAREGGGLWSCALVTGSTFVGNSATRAGGGLYTGVPATIRNCTFFANAAPTGSGVVFYEPFSPGTGTIERSIVAFGLIGEGVACEGFALADLSCCDVFGNAGGDWVGCLTGQLGVAGNIAADPLFCAPPAQLGLCSDSPCAPAHSGGCGLIGARPVDCGDCGATAVEATTWGRIKFRAGR